ncbi:MAG: pyrroline-5-carboxylate reductase [Pseudomonadota bacterium]
MELDAISTHGLVLLGCGKMGTAMLDGWLTAGLPPAAVYVIDPHPTAQLQQLVGSGLNLNEALPVAPAICVLAVKPQLMDAALPAVTHMGGGRTLVLSVAAGTPVARFEQAFGAQTPIIRAMPNTPAAIGQGITALVGNAAATERHMGLAEDVFAGIGQSVRLDSEAQIDAVTGLSGSGPAYVFHLVECMAQAGEAEGLPAEMAMKLAVATVAGAGALAAQPGASAAQLRVDVTSPNGTTQAGLEQLMNQQTGLLPLIRRTVAAAAARSRALSR